MSDGTFSNASAHKYINLRHGVGIIHNDSFLMTRSTYLWFTLFNV